jgi:glutamine synthetase
MAKPIEGIPGNSGHIHLSLTDLNGTNLFARGERDPSAPFPDVEYLSNLGRYFLAGVLDALPDIMPLLAPNINSYKRMVENYWAPIRVSWGFEDRLSSVRLVAPPTCKPKSTRLEVRVPGADLHPHYALSGLFRAGLRGVDKGMQVKLPPGEQGELLPNSLGEAVGRFERPGSVAREIMGDAFVDAFTISRRHELRVWREAVTDW